MGEGVVGAPDVGMAVGRSVGPEVESDTVGESVKDMADGSADGSDDGAELPEGKDATGATVTGDAVAAGARDISSEPIVDTGAQAQTVMNTGKILQKAGSMRPKAPAFSNCLQVIGGNAGKFVTTPSSFEMRRLSSPQMLQGLNWNPIMPVVETGRGVVGVTSCGACMTNGAAGVGRAVVGSEVTGEAVTGEAVGNSVGGFTGAGVCPRS